ncbi:internal scaffolding protein [Microviridae sp.]|nr:internal scaffolding protein [Microviridae sp.]
MTIRKNTYDKRMSMSREQIRKSYGISINQDECMTHQEFKEECNIYNLIKNHGYDYLQNLNQSVTAAQAMYGDYTQINEYQTALNLVQKSNEMFMQIPSDIRKKFNNDAGQYLEFVSNPKNQDKLIEYGLATHNKEYQEESKRQKFAKTLAKEIKNNNSETEKINNSEKT